jgi:hypothetical protein
VGCITWATLIAQPYLVVWFTVHSSVVREATAPLLADGAALRTCRRMATSSSS